MGLRQLPARGARKGWVGGVACGLTAAGLCVAALEMAQIHPHQYLYFNFFVDRKTPERLRTRYTMDHWDMAMRQSYEHLLRQTPTAAINLEKQYLISRLNLSKMILPAADRHRFTHDPSRDADFYLNGSTRQSFLLKDPFPPVLHRFKVYNNTMLILSTPDLSRVDPAFGGGVSGFASGGDSRGTGGAGGRLRCAPAWQPAGVGEGGLRAWGR